jgi:hypothetical protein
MARVAIGFLLSNRDRHAQAHQVPAIVCTLAVPLVTPVRTNKTN